MALSPGTTFGPYQITGTLGAGGMGEVYRAKDSRLGREVAVKVLPETIASNAEAMARFEREARAVAALSHPNILAIHDFGVENGTAYAVTELLEGETLRQRLDGSPLPVRKVLDYAAQIALGLAAAHGKGVVHRDLKPENVIITNDGRAKILDFGLAKMEAPDAEDSTASPTVDAGTRPGTVMGTMGYMSPEQLRGKEVDARTDIFSFGSVLYEMVTGRKAFWHETAADTMSAILKEDPPSLSGSGLEIPPALQQIIHHCLEKNPAERFQSARDLAFHLEAVGTVSSSAAMEAPALDESPSRRGMGGLALFAAGHVLGAAVGALLALQLAAPEPAEPPTMRYLSYSGKDSQPSASPDGRLVAYASVHEGQSQIWLKQFPGGDEVALTKGPDDRLPRISPDGSQVLFTRVVGATPSVYKIPVVGGEPRKVVDDAYDADWSPDGSRITFIRDRIDNGVLKVSLWTVEATGQGSQKLAEVERARIGAARWSPDGRTIAVVKAGLENAPNELLLVPAEGGEPRTLTPPPPRGRLSSPVWVGDGTSILYAQTDSFASSSTDEGAGRVILHDIGTDRAQVKLWLPNTANNIDLLGPGKLVMGISFQRQNLLVAGIRKDAPADRGRWLTRGNSVDRQPKYSPDGKWVLFSSNRGGNLDLWKMEAATGAIRRITEDEADDWDPGWTPDGESIVWSSNRSGHFEIWICSADGTGTRQLSRDGFDAENPTVTPDGEWVIYNSGNPEHAGVWRIRLDGTDGELVIPGTWSTPDVSPDGLHVAYRATSEPRSLFVSRLDTGEQVIPPIPLPGSTFSARPRWMPGGRQFVYTADNESGARGLYIQDFVPGRDTTATRRPLLEFVLDEWPESFDVSPDGSDVVYSIADSQDSLMLAEGLTGVEPARRGGR